MPDYGGPSGFGGGGDPGGGGPAGSGGASGSGDFSGGPGSASSADKGGPSAADKAALAAAKAAIASGKNPFASSTQQSIAKGLVDRGFFGGKDDKPQGITGLLTNLFGYDQKKSLLDNVIDIVVPMRNTPLGIVSALVPGLTRGQQAFTGLANTLVGRANKAKEGIMGIETPESELATTVADEIQSRAYTGRPDDAPQPAPKESPTISPKAQQAIDAVNDMIQQRQSNVGTKPSRATTSAGKFLQDQYVQSQSIPSVGLPQNTVQTAGLFDTLKNITDNVTQIPGGYQIGDTQYTGTYQKNAPARTFSKTEEEYVAPFSAEMFKQGISTLNPFD